MDAATLLAAIVDDPTAIDRWLVYADWLLDRGDPRGELINLEIALEAGNADAEARARVNRLRREEERLFTPRFAEQSHYWSLDLWRGFVRGASLIGAQDDLPGAEAVAALCAEPHAALLERLSIRAARDVVAPLFATQHRRLSSLRISAIDDDRFATSTPVLEELRLPEFGLQQTTKLEHSHLRELEATSSTCPALAAGNFALPELRALSCGIDADDALLENPRSILYRPPPRLASMRFSLGAENPDFEFPVATPALAARVIELPAIRAATSFSLGVCDVDVLEALAADPRALVHLERLEIDLVPPGFATELTADEVAALKARVTAAFPRTQLEIPWETFLPPEAPDEDRPPPPPIDDQSRGPDGRIDAIGKFSRG
jgi:uncharacterized protein (TIGR02996 family)